MARARSRRAAIPPLTPSPSLSQALRQGATDVLAAQLRNASASSTPGFLRTPYR
ncbi:hypothetical protein DICSQDRAFT_140798 [Dichomitus squalens LYAD-421 SS1]|uniref:Uncharacterized protein n=1 Tax=Dichomitus squalens (strain LYAD-421) TaxID=732165 RepID=R7SL50_DICSQ|nr:uncharacterized protein DICSQDRAFT_140798 [Dichomitus squalens LYAD-421 SS1]EJF56864.1 hypothetical protein DICSQDRAFT_140798 [Dichomitus squalens LYAD-421 SS1]